MCPSDGRLALWCVCSPERLQQLSLIGGGSELLRRLVSGVVPWHHLACHAAAAPNPYRDLVLGLPASLR